VTAWRRLEEQLRQQQKLEAIGRLAGGIAHDFNNILTVIGGLCESLERTLPEGAHGRDDVLSIRDAGERAAALTAQLLAFSRRSIVDPAVIDVNAAIERLGGMLRRLIGEDVAVSTDLARDLAAVEADPGQLDQVLVNLVLNARDAMPGGGDVLVRTRNVVLGAPESSSDGPPAGRFVELSVKDTGVGMSDEVQARIFEPFFTTKRIGEGTGLGLATVHGIVAQARGRITVESRPGAGTTFTLLFPATERAPASRPPAEAPAPGGSETILVVEDEEPVRRLVCRALKGGGYTVIEAGSGAAALAAFDALGGGRLDLLVTDVVMPRMGGRELAELISQRCPDLRILFMSGYTDDAVLREGVSQAEVTFLQKPFTPRQLAEKVRAALSKPAR